MMTFDEFLDLIKDSKPSSLRHFKPYGDPILNAHHPEVKDDVFVIAKHDENVYDVWYPNRDDALHEEFSQSTLEDVFQNRNWENFTLYNPSTDMLDWIEHPSWGIYT